MQTTEPSKKMMIADDKYVSMKQAASSLPSTFDRYGSQRRQYGTNLIPGRNWDFPVRMMECLDIYGWIIPTPVIRHGVTKKFPKMNQIHIHRASGSFGVPLTQVIAEMSFMDGGNVHDSKERTSRDAKMILHQPEVTRTHPIFFADVCEFQDASRKEEPKIVEKQEY